MENGMAMEHLVEVDMQVETLGCLMHLQLVRLLRAIAII
jgi:hypothetical protein